MSALDPYPVQVLDVSRLVSRRSRGAPTGIDRIELKAAEEALRSSEEVRFFAMRGNNSWFVPTSEIKLLCEVLAERWRLGTDESHKTAAALFSWLGLPPPERSHPAQPDRIEIAGPRNARGALRTRRTEAELRGTTTKVTYRNVSHHHLDKDGFLEGIKRRWNAVIDVFWHDGIPISFPEYSREGDPEKHRQRLRNMLQWADMIRVNSQATHRELQLLANQEGFPVPDVHVELLSPSLPSEVMRLHGGRPFFVAIGTIEPRKNHALLLQIWRELAQLGGEVPALVLIGRRGWMSTDTFALLDRCEALRHHVFEAPDLPDAVVASLLASAKGLLMPSFAEGFGLPVAEAAAYGTPVVAAPLPVYEEFARGRYKALSPLDGTGWLDEILTLAAHNKTA